MKSLSVLLACCVAAVVGLAARAAAPPVLLTYNAITDETTRPEPPLPKMGPAGTVIVDPTFGSRILRVTDENTMPAKRGWSFVTSSGGFVNSWNSDSTVFWAIGPAGAVPFAFDAKTMKVTRLGDGSGPAGGLVLPQHGPFSYRQANIMYVCQGMTVQEYDFKTGRTSLIFDATKLRPDLTGAVKKPYGYPPSVSDDDTKITFAFGGFQDTFPYIAHYDRKSGKAHILNTAEGKIDGRPAGTPMGWGVHSVYIDRTGRFVVIGKGEGRKEGPEWAVWDTQSGAEGGTVKDIEKRWSGHEVSGFGWRINQAGYYGGQPSFYDEAFWIIRPLDKLEDMRPLIDPSRIPSPHGGGRIDGHLSWHNAQPDVLVPVIESIERNARNTTAWRAWDNEIIGLRTDGREQTVWRFAHHRSIWDGTNAGFWDSPRGNVSKDGRWFMFTSNWGRSLGDDADPSHKGARRDVFVVDLMSAHPPEGAKAGGK